MNDGEGGKDLNIDEAAKAAAAGDKGTQTQGGETGSDAGNGKTDTGTGDGTGTDKGGSGEGGGENEDLNPRTGKPWTLEEWRDKFRDSAKGAQDLLTQVNTLKGEGETNKATIAKLEKDLADLKQIAEGKNPDGLKSHELQAQLAKTSEELALIKENSALDSFEKSTPLATGKVRESLKALARANPKESLQKLYEDHLKAGAEAAEAKRVADEEARKKGAGDQGKGTSTREPASGGKTVSGTKGDTGLTLEEFNALPVVKRRDLIERYDIR